MAITIAALAGVLVMMGMAVESEATNWLLAGRRRVTASLFGRLVVVGLEVVVVVVEEGTSGSSSSSINSSSSSSMTNSS